MTAVAAVVIALMGSVPASMAAPVNPGPVGNGFVVTPGDLAFILKQIKIAERHATTLTASDPCGTLLAKPGDNIPDTEQVPDILTSYGLRTVDGSCNNLKNDTTKAFGAADQVFPRLTNPVWKAADSPTPPGFPPSTPTYQGTGNVVDSQPRIVSNLIVDQTSTNPAAVAASGQPVRTQDPGPSAVPCTTDPAPDGSTPGSPPNCTPSHKTLFIPNITTDVGLSPPYNSVFTFFGQFFDHGVDQTVKSGSVVFVPLKADDPLRTLGPDGRAGTGDEVPASQAFMVLTRAQNQPGGDQNATNTDTPWVDQSQTYTSHASHQVFLRQYVAGTGTPGPNNAAAVATGELLHGLPAGQTYTGSPDMTGGESTWASVKKQAHDLLGLQLTDLDVLNVPMLAVDPYGKYLPGPNGLPQYVLQDGSLLEGNLANPVPVPANVVHFDTPFVGDIAHNADPSEQDTNNDGVPDTFPTPDSDTTVQTDFTKQPAGTYDDELLGSHASCGDGRCNENIALTSIHQVFHSEHNRLVGYIKNVLESDTSATGVAALAQWKATGVAGANGTGSYGYGERLFQAARFVTEMEYQHLVFEEFARKVQPAIRPFHVYSPDINPAIEAEFAHAVYRFGHSMLDDIVARTNPDGSDNGLPLLKAFLNPPALYTNNAGNQVSAEAGAGSVFMGSSDQTGNEIDEFVTETLRNNLLGLPLDLPSINMARAREAGVPPLNDVRRQIFARTNDGQLAPYTSWADFGQHLKHPESLINFVAAYGKHPSITGATTLQAKRDAARAIVNPAPGDVPPLDAADFMFSTGAYASGANGVTTTGLDDVDLWVGGLAEVTNLFGGLLGSTFNYVFQTQLENLQDGDRLYYLARTPGLNLRTQLEGNSFSEMIQRNTDNTNTLKADAFATADCKFQLANITSPYTAGSPTLSQTLVPPVAPITGAGSVNDDPSTVDCDENALLLQQPDGTIQYRSRNTVDPSGINGQSVYEGTAGVDRINGGNDNDTFWGAEGNDIIEGNGGDDVALGGAGDDIITDLDGADVPKGGPGNDAIDAGPGDDIPMGNDGQDFINGGANDNEVFAGEGNDFIIAGQGADAVFGDGGDDWIEGGTGQDLLQGDHGAPFFDDPGEPTPGNDIFVGQIGENDYDAEGGDDIMAQNAAIDRNAGAGGYDWAIHQYDTIGADDDMMINNFLLGVPIQVVVNRDRWQETEADSGSNFNDVIRGTSEERITGPAGFIGCDALDQAGVDRITGLGALVKTFPTLLADVVAASTPGFCPLKGSGPNGDGVWAEGNILLGGGGNDVIEGRENNDIIDGDHSLNVRISVRANPDGTGAELGTTDLMENQALTGNFGAGTTGMTLQQAVFAGKVNPGQLVSTREIALVGADNKTLTPMGTSANVGLAGDCPAINATSHMVVPTATTKNCDTAVYSAAPDQYLVTRNADGSVTVAAANGAAVPFDKTDGIDTLWNIENLRFCTATDPVTKLCSAFQDVSVPTTVPVVAAAPTNVSATVTGTQASVSFTPPTTPGVTGFVVTALSGTTSVATAVGTSSPVIVPNLPAGSLTFTVHALVGSTVGTESAPSAPVTVVGSPGAPTGVTAVPGNAQATIGWAPASTGSPATSFTVTVRNGATLVQNITGLAPTATSQVVTGLTNGTTYTVTVTAVNTTGSTSAAAVSVTPAGTTVGGAPSVPTNVTATPGNAQATVSWTPGAGGGTVAEFRLQIRTGTTVVRTITGIAGTATSTVATGLTNGTAYNFRVRAVNATAASAFSTASTAVTPSATAGGGGGGGTTTAPATPTIGTAAPGNARATVRWTGGTGGGTPTSFSVQVRTGTGGATLVRTVTGIAATATSNVVTGLTNGTTYQFQVVAVNAVGSSAASALSNSVTPATVPGAPAIGLANPGAAGGTLTASVNWAAPIDTGGVPITGYTVRALRMSANGAVLSTTTFTGVAASARTFSMTLPAGNYRFTVQAVNSVGAGAQSARSIQVAAR